MDTLLLDLKQGLRELRRSPGLTAVTVLTLAFAIGASAAIFSVVHGVLLRPLPYAEKDRLVRLRLRVPAQDLQGILLSVQELFDLRAQARTLDALVEYHQMLFTLLGRGEPDRVRSGVVSWNFFQELGVEPTLGRHFTAADEAPGAEAVVLLSHDYWRRRFGGDPGVVGEVLTLNDRPATVAGVLKPLPRYPDENEVYMPTTGCPSRSSERTIHRRSSRLLQVLGRLAPGVTPEEAGAELTALAARMFEEHPDAYQGAPFTIEAVPLEEELTAAFRPTAALLVSAVGLLLFISCANVASLTLTRLLRRRQEVTVRSALGAQRRRLVRQLLIESLVLAALGGGLGLLLTAAGATPLSDFAGRFTVRSEPVAVDGTVVLFTLLLTVLTAVVFGTFPALKASRLDLSDCLKTGGPKATAGAARHRPRDLLLVVQLAVSFTVLIAAGLLVRSFLNLSRVDAGFDPERVLSVRVPLPFSRYAAPEAIAGFFGPLIERLEEAPGVTVAAVANHLPLDGQLATQPLRLEGRTYDAGQVPQAVDSRLVSAGYFRALAIPLLRGRAFETIDVAGAPEVAVVSESLARRFWPGEEAIGKRVSLDGEVWLTIVGVVGEVRQDLAGPPREELYRAFPQYVSIQMMLLVRTTSDPMALVPVVRAAVSRIDPDQPLVDVRTLAQIRRHVLAPTRLTAFVLGLFAVLCAGITLGGVSGLVASAVGERRKEISIRAALGAGRAALVGCVLAKGVLLVVAGLALGAAGALGLGRLTSSLLFGVEPTDPTLFAGVAAALLLAAALASWLPARRALATDLARILREE